MKAKVAENVDDSLSALKTMHLSRKSLDSALKFLSGDVPINYIRFQQKCQLRCIKKENSNSSVMALNLMLEHVRLAMLRHDWEEVKLTLPKFFRKNFTQQYIRKTALQIVCHHPASSADLLQDELQTWLQTTNLSENRLRNIFCVPEPMDLPTEEEPENHNSDKDRDTEKCTDDVQQLESNGVENKVQEPKRQRKKKVKAQSNGK